jgi:hypothetical protein
VRASAVDEVKRVLFFQLEAANSEELCEEALRCEGRWVSVVDMDEVFRTHVQWPSW